MKTYDTDSAKTYIDSANPRTYLWLQFILYCMLNRLETDFGIKAVVLSEWF